MKDSKRQEKPTAKAREGDRPDESPPEPMAGYTPKQREAFQRGLRIWARVAIRSYMRKKEAGDLHETTQGPAAQADGFGNEREGH